jgi:hypothetical protein
MNVPPAPALICISGGAEPLLRAARLGYSGGTGLEKII